jgi:hypothetical protein
MNVINILYENIKCLFIQRIFMCNVQVIFHFPKILLFFLILILDYKRKNKNIIIENILR